VSDAGTCQLMKSKYGRRPSGVGIVRVLSSNVPEWSCGYAAVRPAGMRKTSWVSKYGCVVDFFAFDKAKSCGDCVIDPGKNKLRFCRAASPASLNASLQLLREPMDH
jgi:hypothetical protein